MILHTIADGRHDGFGYIPLFIYKVEDDADMFFSVPSVSLWQR